MLRVFFEWPIEWDWTDAPMRNLVRGGDIPTRPEPLPRFLDDRDAAMVMAAARAATDPRDRLITDHRGPVDRHLVARIVRRAGRVAGVRVHPRQLRHTPATQAINRGMRLEAIIRCWRLSASQR